jgi:mycothiol synthase
VDVTDEVAGPSAELVVHPAARGRGFGRALIEAVAALAAAEAPGPDEHRLRLWAHGQHPSARALAHRMGFDHVRSLWQLRRSLLAAMPDAPLPDGVSVRPFEPGRDDRGWLDLNARAFAEHAEQGSWTADDLGRRLAEPWFDPAGFFLAERGARLVGFHWTKVHGRAPGPEHGHAPIGEVYVLGVDPDERGSGLGRALTVLGLCHLRDLGLTEAMLYVDEANSAAIGLYRGLGFSHWDTDVMYAR